MAIVRRSITSALTHLLRRSSSSPPPLPASCSSSLSTTDHQLQPACPTFPFTCSHKASGISSPSVQFLANHRSFQLNEESANRPCLSHICTQQIRSKGSECLAYGRIWSSFTTYSTSAPADPPSAETASDTSPKVGQSGGILSFLKGTLSDLDSAHPSAVGLGLAGAIPFVVLTPPLCYFLPLPHLLQSSPVEAQAAYGAVILSFLGGPHWGLAMAAYAKIPATPHSFFGLTLHTLQYVWSVVPSLLAWPALLLPNTAKLSMLVVSFGFVLGIDAMFARMGLMPSWYLPLRILLSLIAMLSLGSSLLITATKNAIHHSDNIAKTE